MKLSKDKRNQLILVLICTLGGNRLDVVRS